MIQYATSFYPTCLATTISGVGRALDYLDIAIFPSFNGGLTTNLYDKRRLPAYAHIPIVRFPHWNDALDHRTKLNCIMSQIIRCSRICGQEIYFLTAVNNLTRDMVHNGYPKTKVLKSVRKGFYRLAFLYGRPWRVLFANFIRLWRANTY